MKTVIFDLDGTLALIEHRQHLVEGKKKNFDEFYRRCVDDLPNIPVVELCKRLSQDYKIRILSGRSEAVRTETIKWLSDNHIPFAKVQMRPIYNSTPDEILKKEWADSDKDLSPDNVLCVFDDRNKVVKMWRDNGYTCLQVADGSF